MISVLSRTNGILLLTCATILFYAMFLTRFPKSIFSHLGLQQQQHKEKIALSSTKTVIILVSQPRSGSTLLGDFIKDLEPMIYFYEPLQALLKLNEVERQSLDYKSNANLFLKQLFLCHFTKDIEATLSKVYRGFFSRTAANLCQKITSANARLCNEPRTKIFNQIFNDYKTIFAKLLEPRLPFDLRTLVGMASNSHLIYLVRDPRASFWSLLNKGWLTSKFNDYFKSYVVNRCKEMNLNLQEMKKIANYNTKSKAIILRHEDVINNPLNTMKILSKFLKRKIPDHSLKNFMMKVRNDSNHHGDAETDEKKAWPNWHHDAGEDFVEFVEKHCEALMNMTGYKLRRRSKNIANYDENLIIEKDHVKLLNDYSDLYDDDFVF